MIALPQDLADALDDLASTDLRDAVGKLSDAYRVGKPTAVSSFDDAAAYAVYRAPATFAAVSAVLRALPPFAPASFLDAGAGPGTATWAASEVFASIEQVTCVETNAHMRAVGERLRPGLSWREVVDGPADLVIASYAVGEGSLDVDELWEHTNQALVLIEPGTPRGFAMVLDARTKLLERGAHVAAPCPHDGACPMRPPAWCHFAQRLPRAPLHRMLKDASLPYEDEKFSYVALMRGEVADRPARIVDHPRYRRHLVELSLCTPDGLRKRAVPRSDPSYKVARKLEWGDAFSEAPRTTP